MYVQLTTQCALHRHRKTSSSVLHGQVHSQDFSPPQRSYYLPTGGNQICFHKNLQIRKAPMSLTISRLFEMEIPVQQGRGKCTSLRTPIYANNCKPNNLEAFQNKFRLQSRGKVHPPEDTRKYSEPNPLLKLSQRIISVLCMRIFVTVTVVQQTLHTPVELCSIYKVTRIHVYVQVHRQSVP